jgi:hypothetical protein
MVQTTINSFMKTTGQAFLCLFVFSLFMTSCKCSRTSEIVGPAACPSDNFSYSPLLVKDHASSDILSLDLENSYADISISFNESISYVFIITGKTSGAIFKLNGNGNAINYKWYGNSTNGKYFEAGETLSYSLTNICKQEALAQGQIVLNSLISYSGFGIKVVNYENDPGVSFANYGEVFDCPPYDTDPATVYGNSHVMTSGDGGYMASPQGGNYFHYEALATIGDSGDGTGWYFGGTDFGGINYASLGTDPSNVYLNFYGKGKANSQILMQVYETAHGISLKRKFLANVSPDQWTLFSVRLSDIGILDPSKITKLSLNINAASYQDSKAAADLDLVIFTKDKPF